MSQNSTAAFIIRLWVESREIEGAKPIWRGYIEQAESGNQQYLTSLDSVVRIMAAQLERMGVDPIDIFPHPGLLRRLRSRLSGHKPA